MVIMTGFGQPQAPQNVEHITKAAQEYEYDAAVPLRYWLRTASAILKEADIYSQEGDDETTYFLLFRHAHLILANLAQHSEANNKSTRPQLKEAERKVNENLRILDILRPKVNERYEKYMIILRERETRRKSQARGDSREELNNHYYAYGGRQQPQRLQAHEHQELAVKLAQKEFSRRAATRETAPASAATDQDDLSRGLQAIRAQVHSSHQHQPRNQDLRERAALSQTSSYSYPSVPIKHNEPWNASVVGTRQVFNQPVSNISSPPPAPPKRELASTTFPPRPEKVSNAKAERRASTPEASYTFAPAAYLENGTPLRTLFLPPTLRTTFLRIAHKNTLANLETCAFLAGTLIANAFFVSRLIVPAQTSTSDTCEMTNESDLFDYVDSHDLMILGWIHTHPTQTCFMSSRDLHTHAGYQMMLGESVAIVCAPSKGDTSHGGDWGVYRLTDPPGKKTILSCERPGIFHPHDVDNVYTDALRPGHVVEAGGLEFEVVDLRAG